MSAGKYNIEIESGANFSLEFIWNNDKQEPIDLEGYSAFVQVRECIGGKVIVDISNDTREITLDRAGKIFIEIPGEVTQGLDVKGVWDLLLISPSGERTRLVEGKAILERGVTEI